MEYTVPTNPAREAGFVVSGVGGKIIHMKKEVKRKWCKFKKTPAPRELLAPLHGAKRVLPRISRKVEPQKTWTPHLFKS
jgi:hypothetical protein